MKHAIPPFNVWFADLPDEDGNRLSDAGTAVLQDWTTSRNYLARTEPEPFVATVEQIERQVDLLIERNEVDFYDWWANTTVDVPREPSSYFGLISELELVQLLMKVEATPEQCKAAAMELRKRFADDHLELIAERAEKAVSE